MPAPGVQDVNARPHMAPGPPAAKEGPGVHQALLGCGMSEERPEESKGTSRDPLGKLVGTYSARVKGFVLLALAVGLALFGIVIVDGAAGISRALFEAEDLKGFYAGLGWCFVGGGVFFSLLSLFYITQTF